MKAYQVSMWMVGAAVVLLAGSSASEAGWLRGGGRCHYYPAESTYSVATNPAAATARADRLAHAPAGPAVHRAYKPVNGPEPAAAPPRWPTAHQACTGAMAGGGWSVMPRRGHIGLRQFSTLSVMVVKGDVKDK